VELPELRAVQPHGPYYIAGFSFGGRVAYVMAQRLRAQGEAVALLAMLDTYALTGEDFLGLWPAMLLRLKGLRRVRLGALPGYAAARLRNVTRVLAMRLPQPVFALIRRRFGGETQAVPHALRLAPLEAHAMANRAFKPEPYDGDLVLFRAAGNRPGRHEGWDDLVKGRFEVCEVPGGHTDILAEPRVKILARELDAVLAERQARCGPPPRTIVANAPRRLKETA
jgi:thioesterase domain-containing protein